MEFTDINISSYPNSEKIYIDGTLFPIKQSDSNRQD